MASNPSPPFALAAADIALESGELPAEQVLAGAPAIAARQLWASPDGRMEAGVWEITPGVVVDVEMDEVFVVLAGRATVEVDDGPVLELGPGDVGTLRAGDRAVWRVHETLRKVYAIHHTD